MAAARQPGFKSQLCYSLAVWPSGSYLISLGLSLLTCRIGMRIVAPIKCLGQDLAHSADDMLTLPPVASPLDAKLIS